MFLHEVSQSIGGVKQFDGIQVFRTFERLEPVKDSPRHRRGLPVPVIDAIQHLGIVGHSPLLLDLVCDGPSDGVQLALSLFLVQPDRVAATLASGVLVGRVVLDLLLQLHQLFHREVGCHVRGLPIPTLDLYHDSTQREEPVGARCFIVLVVRKDELIAQFVVDDLGDAGAFEPARQRTLRFPIAVVLQVVILPGDRCFRISCSD